VREYVGGYEDWLRQRPEPPPPAARTSAPANLRAGEPANARTSPPANPRTSEPAAKKLTYREREELEELPARIEALEQEQRTLAAKIAGPAFYKEPADAIKQALERVERVHDALLQAMARWDELESRPR
jgi:ATP-binding cassette subfamily F protein uup